MKTILRSVVFTVLCAVSICARADYTPKFVINNDIGNFSSYDAACANIVAVTNAAGYGPFVFNHVHQVIGTDANCNVTDINPDHQPFTGELVDAVHLRCADGDSVIDNGFPNFMCRRAVPCGAGQVESSSYPGTCSSAPAPLTPDDCKTLPESSGSYPESQGTESFACSSTYQVGGHSGKCEVSGRCTMTVEGLGRCFTTWKPTGRVCGDTQGSGSTSPTDPVVNPPQPVPPDQQPGNGVTVDKGQPAVDGVPITPSVQSPGACGTINGKTVCTDGPGNPYPRSSPPLPTPDAIPVVVIHGPSSPNIPGAKVPANTDIKVFNGTGSGTAAITPSPGSPTNGDALLAQIAANTSGNGVPDGKGLGDKDGNGQGDGLQDLPDTADKFGDGVAPSHLTGLSLPTLPTASGCTFRMPTILGVSMADADLHNVCANIREGSEWLLYLAAASYIVFLFYRTLRE